MRLFLLTSLTMVAFVANSVLTRVAIAGDLIGPGSFAAWRVIAGAAVLAVLVLLRDRRLVQGRPTSLTGPIGLSLYLLGFTLAYVRLDTGLGALVLFGGVQVFMFAGALIGREAVPPRRYVGAAMGLAGLIVLLLPGLRGGGDALALGLMVTAALGWAIYSLGGRGAADPLGETAKSFLFAVPVVIGVLALMPPVPDTPPTLPAGMALALVSGGVTSGLGYALWFRVLLRLDRSIAAVAQLTVPLIAAAGGLALIGERPGPTFAIAAALVLGGVAVSIGRRSRQSS